METNPRQLNEIKNQKCF